MLNFFYESLDTLRTVKLPTKKEVMNMMLLILAIIMIMGVFFAIVDQLGLSTFKVLFNTLSNLIG